MHRMSLVTKSRGLIILRMTKVAWNTEGNIETQISTDSPLKRSCWNERSEQDLTRGSIARQQASRNSPQATAILPQMTWWLCELVSHYLRASGHRRSIAGVLTSSPIWTDPLFLPASSFSSGHTSHPTVCTLTPTQWKNDRCRKVGRVWRLEKAKWT